MSTQEHKRKADEVQDAGSKKQKIKQAYVHRRGGKPTEAAFKPGDAGIWVTCQKGKERKCIGEMKDVLSEYIEQLYPGSSTTGPAADADDIEGDISAELAELSAPQQTAPFEPRWTDIQCLVFFRTKIPIDPLALVHRIVSDAAGDPTRKRTTVTQRLTPCARLGFANPEGLEEVAGPALAADFHAQPVVPRKFAIRVTLRNHNVLKRDDIIKKVASMVGGAHTVDLKGYDRLVLVDVVRNVCGVVVVGREYEDWKRYNLQEIFDPTPADGQRH